MVWAVRPDGLDELTTAGIQGSDRLARDLVGVLRLSSSQEYHDLLPMTQVSRDHPFDQLMDAVLDLLRHIGEHSLLKRCPDLVAARQLTNVRQPHGGIIEIETTLLHALQDILDLGEMRFELAQQFALVCRCQAIELDKPFSRST